MKIDHIGIATNGIAAAAGFWRDALGLGLGEIRPGNGSEGDT